MLIKEYRIPLPLSVEEYRIAQLYMIAKKSRTESSGQGSGVVIVKNEPYFDEKTGQKGQYTIKSYFVASHLPSWIKSVFNNTSFAIKEEAWNCYPYTKTIYTCSFMSNFLIEIETYYFDEPGLKENVFKLNDDELKKVTVDYIDIVRDQLSANDYVRDEDPQYFISEKTQRGPLNENWLEEYRDDYKRSLKNGTKPKNNVMCAYKLCKVKVNVWAAQTRIEQFIHNSALRKVMVRAHRQAWCWQDEWFGLTMDDIRTLEKETQRQLAMKMNQGKKTSRGSISIDMSCRRKSNHRSGSITNTTTTDNDFNLISWRIDKITNKESEGSGDEWYDAKDELSSLCKWSSLECMNKLDDEQLSTDNEQINSNRLSISKTPDSLSKESLTTSTTNLDRKLSASKHKCQYSALVFVLHGGHLLDNGNDLNNKYTDFTMFKSTIEQTMRTSYSSLNDKLMLKLICCPMICKSSLQFLSKLSTSYQANGKFDYENLPIDCLPLFATNLNDYKTQIDKTIISINQSYKEFVESDGKFFNGRITFICDFLGGILAYDSLCKQTDETMMNTSNKSNNEEKEQDVDAKNRIEYDFHVNDLFLFGCPLSLVLAYRKMTSNVHIKKPNCSQVYNLFHPLDRLVMRIEPLIDSRFSEISAISVPKYNKQILYQQIISIRKHLKFNQKLLVETEVEVEDTDMERHSNSTYIVDDEEQDSFESNLIKILNRWWGKNRIDYELYCPRGINNFPNSTLPVLFHSSFWESSDVASFVLDKLMFEVDRDHYCRAQKLEEKLINKPKEKWLKKSTSFKIKNISSNHRANDIIYKEGQEQILTARFIYGPLDMITLVGEKVDIYLMKDMNKDDWTFLGTEFTDKAGKVYHTIHDPLGCGVYPVKMIVRGDHSSIDLFLTILPPQTEAVVFSIDGSFAASVSVSGKDPKVRPSSVDVVRFWQEMGYLIIYVTGRPGMQQQKVIAWLSEHNFPHGLIYFTGGLTKDPLKHKAMYLSRLQNDVELSIFAGYGSAKDIWIYQSLGLNRDNIFIVGRVSKKQQHLANVLTDGYAAHLEELKLPGCCRRANNSKINLPKGNFGLCNLFCGIRLRRKHASVIRTYPVPTSVMNTPRLSNKFNNQLTISNASTLDSYKSVSVNHSPTSSNSNLFTNFFHHNRTSSNRFK